MLLIYLDMLTTLTQFDTQIRFKVNVANGSWQRGFELIDKLDKEL